MKKLFCILSIATLILCMFAGATEVTAESSGPVLRLDCTTAQNPYLDLELDPEIFNERGGYSAEVQFTTQIRSQNAESAYAYISVFGTRQDGASNNKAGDFIYQKQNGIWYTDSVFFSAVGTYTIDGVTYPGNLLRIGLWNAKGSVYIREVKIYGPSNELVYKLSEDPVLKNAVSVMQANGNTEMRISDIKQDGIRWSARQFGSGSFDAYVQTTDNFVSTTTATTTATTTKQTTISTAKTTQSTKSTSTAQTTVTIAPAVTTTGQTSATVTTVSATSTTTSLNPTSSATTQMSAEVSSTTTSSVKPVEENQNVSTTQETEALDVWLIAGLSVLACCLIAGVLIAIKLKKK